MSLTAVQHPIGHTERVPKILYFVSNLTFNIGGKLNDDTYRRPADATTRSPHLPSRSKEGLETICKQWVSFIAVQHTVGRTERVLKILYIVSNLRVDLGWKWYGATNT